MVQYVSKSNKICSHIVRCLQQSRMQPRKCEDACRIISSGVVINQSKKDSNNQLQIDKILGDCSSRKDTNRKVNDECTCTLSGICSQMWLQWSSWCAPFRFIPLEGCQQTRLEVAWVGGGGSLHMISHSDSLCKDTLYIGFSSPIHFFFFFHQDVRSFSSVLYVLKYPKVRGLMTRWRDVFLKIHFRDIKPRHRQLLHRHIECSRLVCVILKNVIVSFSFLSIQKIWKVLDRTAKAFITKCIL